MNTYPRLDKLCQLLVVLSRPCLVEYGAWVEYSALVVIFDVSALVAFGAFKTLLRSFTTFSSLVRSIGPKRCIWVNRPSCSSDLCCVLNDSKLHKLTRADKIKIMMSFFSCNLIGWNYRSIIIDRQLIIQKSALFGGNLLQLIMIDR